MKVKVISVEENKLEESITTMLKTENVKKIIALSQSSITIQGRKGNSMEVEPKPFVTVTVVYK